MFDHPPVLLAGPVHCALVLWVQCFNGSDGRHVIEAKVLRAGDGGLRWRGQGLASFDARLDDAIDALQDLQTW